MFKQSVSFTSRLALLIFIALNFMAQAELPPADWQSELNVTKVSLVLARPFQAGHPAPNKPCLLTLDRVEARRVGIYEGELRIRVAARDCTSVSGEVEVAVGPYVVGGGIQHIDYQPSNIVTVWINRNKEQRYDETIRFTCDGDGPLSFRVVILNCGEQKDCDDGRWLVKENLKESNRLNFDGKEP
jgi:hypothetical protein